MDMGAKGFVFFTSICANYLDKALTLADSVKTSMPNSIFVIALVEREIPEVLNLSDYPSVDHVILACEFVDVPSFDEWVFRHSIVEASTAVKGALLSHLYRTFPEHTNFAYLDPDTYVYSAFTELAGVLDKTPIVLTPHLDVPGNLEMELSALKHGVFNLGFVAVRRDSEAERFINWWAERLDYACYDDIANGVFTDQKWVNLAPGFFNVHVLRHPGYNFATWSLLDRKLSAGAEEELLVNNLPLRFAHFSGFDGGTFHSCVERWAPDDRDLLNWFAKNYIEECNRHQSAKFKGIAWSYSNYSSGKKISRRSRLIWREVRRDATKNPFQSSNFSMFFLGILNRIKHCRPVAEFVRRLAGCHG